MATAVERKVLDEIEPYVLLVASTLITCAFRQNYAAFDLLSRPHVCRAVVSGGRVEFELPDWFPVEEALLSAVNGGLHSIVKHLALKRMGRAGRPTMRIHQFEVSPELCREGELLSLTYSPWFRFAAPPYRFELENQVAAYVAAALGHLGRARGLSVRSQSTSDLSVLWLSERLRIEVLGAGELTEIAILLDADETSLTIANRQLSVSRRMFHDVYTALRSAGETGEQFGGASLLIEEDQVLLYGDGRTGDVQA